MKNNHNNSQEKKKELTKTIIVVQETAKNCLNKMYNDDTISYEKFSEKLSAKIYEGDNIIDRTSMSNYMNGKTPIPLNIIIAMQKINGYSYDYILGIKKQKDPNLKGTNLTTKSVKALESIAEDKLGMDILNCILENYLDRFLSSVKDLILLTNICRSLDVKNEEVYRQEIQNKFVNNMENIFSEIAKNYIDIPDDVEKEMIDKSISGLKEMSDSLNKAAESLESATIMHGNTPLTKKDFLKLIKFDKIKP